MRRRFSSHLLVLALALTVSLLRADDTLTTIYPFNTANEENVVPRTSALVRAPDGSFYGTTYGEEDNPANLGTVFRLTPDGTVTTVHQFNRADGANPAAALLLAADGNFYGATARGGSSNQGTIFRLSPDGTLATLHSFDIDDGAGPMSAMIEATDGNFYGTTSVGMANLGTVFRLTPDGGTLTTIYQFTDGGGMPPTASLVQGTDGNFYGATSGSMANLGTVFRLTPGGTLTTLHIFSTFTDGNAPEAALVQGRDGNFYGTTYGGGSADGSGTVFRVTPDGTLTTLHSFDSTEGIAPSAALIQGRDGNFYGTTYGNYYNVGDPPSSGTVFKITPDGTLTTLHQFTHGDGAGPAAALLQADDGSLYGTTTHGGINADGTIFRVTTDSTVPPPPPEPVLPVVTAQLLGSKIIQGNGGVGEIQLTLDSARTVDLSVNYNVSGTATMETDYAELHGGAKIKAGRTTKIIHITALPERSVTGKKTVVITLLGGDGYTVGTSTPLRFKIVRP